MSIRTNHAITIFSLAAAAVLGQACALEPSQHESVEGSYDAIDGMAEPPEEGGSDFAAELASLFMSDVDFDMTYVSADGRSVGSIAELTDRVVAFSLTPDEGQQTIAELSASGLSLRVSLSTIDTVYARVAVSKGVSEPAYC